MMNNMMTCNMANMLAEDTGMFELRSPVVSGMQGNEPKNPVISGTEKKGWLYCLLNQICRH